MFHLMTHAFFKALLFMAAGSIIGAMAGEQNLDRMGGFRKVLPFTFGCFVIGGLALSGIPPFSGFFSKDEILLVIGEEGGLRWFLYAAGYIGAFLTAVYTWRMIFRAFWGDPVPEAQELAHGHLHHPEQPVNPATGEVEDTDVGFPGPGHFIAEREWPMKVAMGGLAVLAIVGGVVLIPKTTTWFDTFLEPTFADSQLRPRRRRRHAAVARAGPRRRPRPGRHRRRLRRLGARPGRARPRPRALRARSTSSSSTSGTSTSSSTCSSCARGPGSGASAADLRARVVNGTLVGGTTGLVRAGSAAVRATAERLPARLRGPARGRPGRRRPLLPPAGLMLELSYLLWLPLAAGVLGLLVPAAARWVALAGTVLALALAVAFTIDFDAGARGLQHVTDETWITQLGIHYKLGLSGLNVILVLFAAVVWVPATLWAGQDRPAPGLFFFWMGLAETAVLGALLAQDLALFVVFFDLMLVPIFFLTGGWGGPNRIPRSSSSSSTRWSARCSCSPARSPPACSRRAGR